MRCPGGGGGGGGGGARLHEPHDSVPELVVGLASLARYAPRVVPGAERAPRHRVRGFRVRAGKPLETPDVPLAQFRRPMKPFGFGLVVLGNATGTRVVPRPRLDERVRENARGVDGARQVRGHHGQTRSRELALCVAVAGEKLGERPRLRAADIVQGRVSLPLDDPSRVPGGLSVPQDEEVYRRPPGHAPRPLHRARDALISEMVGETPRRESAGPRFLPVRTTRPGTPIASESAGPGGVKGRVCGDGWR